ncbi:MAG: ATP-binding protein [Gammaproteobacteria bacterium]|nr:ATP-binding protein [Gammaproteobacteria bacterium]
MNLRRQLLLVSLLTLMLPWAGCEFIRETESALRTGQQQMLAATARALANSMAQYGEEFPRQDATFSTDDQLYIHELAMRPEIDGYFDDWPLRPESLESIRGVDGPVLFAVGSFGQTIYVYVEVSDRNVIYMTSQSLVLDDGPWHADHVNLISSNPPYLEETIAFAAEAPGKILSYKQNTYGIAPEPTITAHWQDIPGGYRLEAGIPAALLGTHLGLVINNTDDATRPGTRSSSFAGLMPGPTARLSPDIDSIAARLVQPGMRLLITDARGWRIAAVGELSDDSTANAHPGFTRRLYDLLVESGKEATFAEPDPLGREQQSYVAAALQGREMSSWFRSDKSGKAIVAVAAPIRAGSDALGAVVLQQDTDAILSLTNEGLARLINVTLIATLLVAGTLLGYATWLSRRVRHLSVAAEAALENEALQSSLPSALASDEIGDLSRSFSSVLQQLGDYNEYLKSLASTLSHELRTPLAIVTSSLENLEHEPLSEAGVGYTARARDGADRLRRILSAMSEANRVEELMANVEPESFDFRQVLESTVTAYRDVYKERSFELDCQLANVNTMGSPELLIQMLDKLIDNAVDFSSKDDTITIRLLAKEGELEVSVTNPGPPLPERMRTQMFDPMVSMRLGDNARHLGLGLYVARLIAAGHGGRIDADNVDGGVIFRILLPIKTKR